MRILLIFLLVALAASGSHADDNMIERIEAAQKLEVPLPESTPYDSDPKARAVYLEEYKKAYWLVLAATMVDCHMAVKGYYEEAFQDGWRDGRKAAMKQHPEKAAQMYGVSLEDYLRCFMGEDADAKK